MHARARARARAHTHKHTHTHTHTHIQAEIMDSCQNHLIETMPLYYSKLLYNSKQTTRQESVLSVTVNLSRKLSHVVYWTSLLQLFWQ